MQKLTNNQSYEAKGLLAADLSARQITRQMDSFSSTGSNNRNNVSVNDRPRPGRYMGKWWSAMFRPFTHIVVTNDTLIAQRYINEVLRPEDITFLVGH